MRNIPSFAVNRTPAQLVSLLASFAVAATVVRFGVANIQKRRARERSGL
ncbi:MAG TPA: hypothetical protein VGN18_05200 [Jatrophihabitans sp.]|jgi:hypothetical protein|nr:hypothetical protein [Jatrophihabitans sp.]